VRERVNREREEERSAFGEAAAAVECRRARDKIKSKREKRGRQ
jgi:hypothetical protein